MTAALVRFITARREAAAPTKSQNPDLPWCKISHLARSPLCYRRCCCVFYDNSYLSTYGVYGASIWLALLPIAFIICCFHIGPKSSGPFFIGSAVTLPLLAGGGAYLGHKKDTKVL